MISELLDIISNLFLLENAVEVTKKTKTKSNLIIFCSTIISLFCLFFIYTQYQEISNIENEIAFAISLSIFSLISVISSVYLFYKINILVDIDGTTFIFFLICSILVFSTLFIYINDFFKFYWINTAANTRYKQFGDLA
jgi:tellurite resistance protein TehA-like permease